MDIRGRTHQVKQAAGEDRLVSKKKKIGKSAQKAQEDWVDYRIQKKKPKVGLRVCCSTCACNPRL